MKITLDPYGPEHPCAAETDRLRHREAWISRNGVVYISTNNLEDAADYDGLTEFARAADEALREAVADQ